MQCGSVGPGWTTNLLLSRQYATASSKYALFSKPSHLIPRSTFSWLFAIWWSKFACAISSRRFRAGKGRERPIWRRRSPIAKMRGHRWVKGASLTISWTRMPGGSVGNDRYDLNGSWSCDVVPSSSGINHMVSPDHLVRINSES